jgi:hypothetical protein
LATETDDYGCHGAFFYGDGDDSRLTVNPEQLKFLRERIVEFLKSESATNEFAVEFADALHKKLLRFFPSATAEAVAAGYIGSLCTLEVLFQKLGLIGEFNSGDKRC